jgi:RNA polymerase sigma-70 factor, ECF subfamily
VIPFDNLLFPTVKKSDSMPQLPQEPNLVSRLCQGQEGAAAELYGTYSNRIRGLIHSRCSGFLAPRLDPEDVLQSVFHAFFLAVRRGVYNIPDSDSLWNLLAAIALNKLRSAHAFHHAARRNVRATESLPAAGAVDHLFSSNLIELAIRDVLEQLPASARAVAQLRLEGYDIAEIAAQLKLSRRSVERLLQRCRQCLRVLLDL